MRSKSGATFRGSGKDGSGYPAGDPAAIFSGGEGRHRDCGIARRGQYRHVNRCVWVAFEVRLLHSSPPALASLLLSARNRLVDFVALLVLQTIRVRGMGASRIGG